MFIKSESKDIGFIAECDWCKKHSGLLYLNSRDSNELLEVAGWEIIIGWRNKSLHLCPDCKESD